MTETIIRPGVPASGRTTPALFPFYTTGEDNLRVTSWNSASAVALKVNGRTLSSSGRATPDSWDHQPNTDRSAKVTDIDLSGSTLLNLTVFASVGAPMMGQTFVKVEMIRGIGVAAIVLGTILQGYITASQAIGFPGSPIQDSFSVEPPPRVIVGTTPAAGNELAETVPTNARWRLVSLLAQFTTDATALPRNPRVEFRTGATTLALFPNPITVNASVSVFPQWVQGLAYDQPHSSNVGVGGLPASAILLAGQTIRTNTENMQLGDAWTGLRYVVQEWLEI